MELGNWGFKSSASLGYSGGARDEGNHELGTLYLSIALGAPYFDRHPYFRIPRSIFSIVEDGWQFCVVVMSTERHASLELGISRYKLRHLL